MKKANIQLGAAVIWFVAGMVWLALAALNGLAAIYLAAAGLSLLAGSAALLARRNGRRSDSESKERGPF